MQSKGSQLAVLMVSLLASGLLFACGDDEGASTTGGGGATAGSTVSGTGGSDGAGGEGGGGGGAPLAGTLGFGSGSRLRARVLDAGNGAVVFRDFQDTELDTPCSLSPSAGGEQVCVPSLASAYYADAGCTTPVAHLEACDVGRFASITTRDDAGCETAAARYFEVTDERDDVDEVFALLGDTCTSYGAPTGRIHDLEEVSVDLFAGGTVTSEPLSAELGRRVWVGEDGAYVALGGYDVERDVDCTVPDGETCMRSLAYFGDTDTFADETCETPVSRSFDHCGGSTDAEHVIEFRQVSCGYELVAYEVGEELARGYVLEGESCVEATAPASYYRIGPEIAAGTFPVFDLVEQGGGDVRVESLAVGETMVEATRSFSGCTDTWVDGTLRCLPPPLRHQPYFFADDGCEVPLFIAPIDDLCGTELVVDERYDESLCVTEITVVRRLGERHDGAAYGVDGNGDCVEVDNGETTLHALSEPVATSEFPELTLRIE